MSGQESIYALIDAAEKDEFKAYREIQGQSTSRSQADNSKTNTLYKSRYPGEYNTYRKFSAATIGPAKIEVPNPSQWLKKHSQEPILPEPHEFHYDPIVPRKDPLPDLKSSPPIYNLRSDKDFVRSNIVTISLLTPPPSTKEELDYTKKKDFGKVPAYLETVKKQVAEETAAIREIAASTSPQRDEVAYQLNEDERKQLLIGLKENWKKLNYEYTTQLKMICETVGQVNRKQWIEKRLAEIEHDISILERENIFVVEGR